MYDTVFGAPIWLWAVIAVAAIVAGMTLARLTTRSPSWYLRRDQCPSCKAQKSLLQRPVSYQTVVFECVRCETKWALQSEDGRPVIVAGEPPLPKGRLVFTHSSRDGNPLFQTEIGELEMDLFNTGVSMRDFEHVYLPRELLAKCWELGVPPWRVSLSKPYQTGTVEGDYEAFVRYCGIETKKKD